MSSSAPAPASASAPPAPATILETPTSGRAVDTEDPDPYPLWSRSKLPVVEEPTPPTSSSSSPTSGSPTQVPPLGKRPASKTPRCQHLGCLNPAKYGLRGETPIACQVHKRAGQYTVNRHGELLVATRDGNAFRTPTAAAAPPSPTNIQTGKAARSDQSERRSTEDGGDSRSPFSSRLQKSARQSPTSAHTFKRTNRPGLSNGDDESSATQYRPCLFPGCDARPTYGLPGATRAVYCIAHKKGSMVPVMTKAPTPQKKTAAGAAVTEGKQTKHARGPPTPTTTPKHGAKKARRGPLVMEEDFTATDGRAKKTGDQGEKKVVKHAASMKGANAAPAGGAHNNPHPSSSLSSASAEAAAVTPKSKAIEKQEMNAAATANPTMPPPPPSSSNRLAEASGMSPSDEILVLRQAREEAKKEAEASGGGRRPRAPSRRALEASGRMKGEGAQWMTREKKAEQTRMNTELREQRKQYRAAGLKMGVVVEALVETAGEAAAAATGAAAVAGSGAAGGGAGGGGGGGGVGGAQPVLGGAAWQKVSPTML